MKRIKAALRCRRPEHFPNYPRVFKPLTLIQMEKIHWFSVKDLGFFRHRAWCNRNGWSWSDWFHSDFHCNRNHLLHGVMAGCCLFRLFVIKCNIFDIVRFRFPLIPSHDERTWSKWTSERGKKAIVVVVIWRNNNQFH